MKAKTYLPLFSGFYDSHWDDVDFYGEDEVFSLPKDKEFWEFVDWEKYHNHIAKEMCSEVQSLLSEFISEIEFEHVVSPKYYNFENNSINCEITFDELKIQEYLNQNKESFDKYILNKYSSRDGFISWYSNDSDEWMDVWQFNEHMVGSVLEFIATNEGFEEPIDLNDCYISLFYKEEIYQYKITD